jgi:septal ring factor EnvC (AmiA/AmiB activator)
MRIKKTLNRFSRHYYFKPDSLKRVILAIGTCLVSALFTPVLADDARNLSSHDLKKQELEQLRGHIAKLRHELESKKSTQTKLRNKLRDVEIRTGEIAGDIKQLDHKITQQSRELKSLQAHQTKLERQKAKHTEKLEQQVRSAFLIGRQEYIKILFNQQDPAAIGRVLTYYNYFSQARLNQINTIKQNIGSLNETKEQMLQKTQSLETLRATRLADQQNLKNNKARRATLLAKVNQEITEKDRQLKGMLEDEKQLEELVRALQHALPDIPADAGNRIPFAQQRGNLAWPSTGPILANFGTTRKKGRLKWQGIVIGVHEGEEVRAVSYGRVAFADWLQGYGMLIIVDHGDGYMSLYGYNQTLLKETGDWLEAGEIIAMAGNSGGQDRPKLYFEIRHNGSPRNPALWCINRNKDIKRARK